MSETKPLTPARLKSIKADRDRFIKLLKAARENIDENGKNKDEKALAYFSQKVEEYNAIVNGAREDEQRREREKSRLKKTQGKGKWK